MRKEWPTRTNHSARRYTEILVFLFIVIIFICYTQVKVYEFTSIYSTNGSTATATSSEKEKYLIHTSSCRIPNADPFNEDVKKFFYREKYTPCSKMDSLTYIIRNHDQLTLHINQTLLKTYSLFKVDCCYSTITRIVHANKSDDDIKISDCIHFQDSVRVESSLLKVTCKNPYGWELYSNVHAVIDPLFVENPKKDAKKLSVVLVGIDTMSKMNIIRTMPKTHKFLETHNFVSLKGYTKIDDNTFPNLMAILTGKRTDQIYTHCDPAHEKMNGCNIIWDKFKNLSYITAYGEDESAIGTFNYHRMGFADPPTTFYFRPYMLAAETLPTVLRHFMTYCTGPVTSGERIMNLAKDFVINLKGYPKFGLFWMNSFSHNSMNTPSAMDEKVVEFLENIHDHLDDTIFVFFSDHGSRFGYIRYTHTGWLEERLPFIYVHLPTSFQSQHPQEYANFVTNAERLTNPFDIYMTIQDVLFFANNNYTVEPSLACPKCQSLFKEVDEKRTCKDCAIEQHWCLCSGHFYVDPRRRIVQDVAEFIISEVNNLTKSYKEGGNCARYHVKNIVSAGMSQRYLNEFNQSTNYFLLIIETRPPAMFEATVETSLKEYSKFEFRLLGDISRINRYAENSKCVVDYVLKKYCYCDGVFTTIKSAICNFFNCIY